MNPSEYLTKLRELVPARTLGLYLLGNALLLSLVDKPEELPQKYAVMILVVNAVCLVFSFVGRLLLDKRKLAAALVSSGALVLLMASQRFYGPLAALGLDTKAAFVIVTLLAAIYVIASPFMYRGNPAV